MFWPSYFDKHSPQLLCGKCKEATREQSQTQLCRENREGRWPSFCAGRRWGVTHLNPLESASCCNNSRRATSQPLLPCSDAAVMFKIVLNARLAVSAGAPLTSIIQISKPDSPQGTDFTRDVSPLVWCLVTSSENVWQNGWGQKAPGRAFVSKAMRVIALLRRSALSDRAAVHHPRRQSGLKSAGHLPVR